jgi:urea carboxylase
MEILSPGLSTTVQDLPGRFVGAGIARGGAADMLSLQAANQLVGNDPNEAGLEITMVGPKILFHGSATVALAGAAMSVTLDKKPVDMWTTIHVSQGSILQVGVAVSHRLGQS